MISWLCGGRTTTHARSGGRASWRWSGYKLTVAWESTVVCMGEVLNMATAMPMSRSETGERIIDTFTKVRWTEYVYRHFVGIFCSRGRSIIILLVQLQFNYPSLCMGMWMAYVLAGVCLCVLYANFVILCMYPVLSYELWRLGWPERLQTRSEEGVWSTKREQ